MTTVKPDQKRPVYFALMRVFGPLLALLLVIELVAPTVVVLDFLVERDRIAKEFCVQRLTPESMRTCHGQCYMMKKLRSVEQHERDLPENVRAMKMDDALPQQPRATDDLRCATARRWSALSAFTRSGDVPPPDHVPWG